MQSITEALVPIHPLDLARKPKIARNRVGRINNLIIMKAKFFAIFFTLLFTCIGAKAQLGSALFGMATHDMGGARNIYLGVAPYGIEKAKICGFGEKYKYDYKSYMGFILGYETQTEGMGYISEISYAQAKYDKSEIVGVPIAFDPNQTANIKSIAFSQLFGKTFNNFKRIQFPIYYGPRVDYLSGGPFHNLTINFCLKARVKFFFTDNIGIYAGGMGFIGWGSKKYGTGKGHYDVVQKSAFLDAGLVICINKK